MSKGVVPCFIRLHIIIVQLYQSMKRESASMLIKACEVAEPIINQTSCADEEFIPIHETTTNHSFEFVLYFIKTGKCTSNFMSFHSCKGLPGILNVKYTERSIISIHANDGHSTGAGLSKSEV